MATMTLPRILPGLTEYQLLQLLGEGGRIPFLRVWLSVIDALFVAGRSWPGDPVRSTSTRSDRHVRGEDFRRVPYRVR